MNKIKYIKIALVENLGSDFVSARLRFALFLEENGIKVTAIIPNDGHREIIEAQGIKTIEVGVNIRGKDVLNKLQYAKKIKQILKEETFDIVHFYRLQPNIIGTFIAGFFTKSKIVNHVTGLGVAFTDNSLKNRVFQLLIKFLYQLNSFCFNPYTIYQNKQDSFDLGIHKNTMCIEGSAVNESRFFLANTLSKTVELKVLRDELGIKEGEEPKVFLFVSRLLKEKGILELIEGFKQAIEETKSSIKLLLVGWSDVENPSSVLPSELDNLIEGYDSIQFLGKRSDIDLLLCVSQISILPTYYREGTPRFLLESMAMHNAIITTKMPGCDHLVPDNKNGLLIEPKSIGAIKKAIIEILSKDLVKLGEESNKLYFDQFSEDKVYNKVLKLYKSILT